MSEYEPRVYVKDGVEKVAQSPSAAVALEFDGYRVKEDASVEESPAPAAQPKAQEPVRDKTPAPRPPAPSDDKD